MLKTKLVESKNNLITKSNLLIEANYKLGVVEQKIILCLASNIQQNDSDFKTYTLPIKEFTNLLGLRGTPKYTELKQITKNLMQKVFEVRIKRKVIQVSWLSYVAYNETEGTIDIRFDPFLRPYLLELKREFTSYRLENVVKLKSSYAIRIYELLKQYEKIKERTFTLTDLREMLGAEGIYPAYGNFKQRVLLPAQKELQNKTDISFEIQEIKVSRRVEKIKFAIQSIKNHDEQLSLFESNLGEFKLPNTFSEKVEKIGLSMGIHISGEVINLWKKHGEDNVITLMEKIQGRTDIENPIGYVTTVLNTSKISSKPVDSISEDQRILPYLVSYFRKSKEALPNWFIIDKAIEELQIHFHMDPEEAREAMDGIKTQLFEVLGIKEYKKDTSVSGDKKKSIEDILEALRKHNALSSDI